MSRSPLAYPLTRSADTDAGGAADLQTDIMRFMAILSMCLLAIFALVQSIPLAPVEPAPAPDVVELPHEPVVATAQPITATVQPVEATRPPAGASLPAKVPEKSINLTHPKWESSYKQAKPNPVASELPPTEPPTPETPEEQGFTLRFASDAALMRAVAAQHVGLYAIDQGRARRMTVSDSRISFWDASTPGAFHEMEAGTVPLPVVDALDRAGGVTGNVSWGVTLPGRMKAQLDELLHAHRGGSLIITADGDIHWEAS